MTRVPVLLALVLLAGCAPPRSSETPLLGRAINAYLAADAETLAAIDKEAQARAAEAVITPGLAGSCTLEAAAARRELLVAALVSGLDRPRLMSMSETARYVNFVNVANFRGLAGPNVELVVEPGPECGKEHALEAVAEATARMQLLKTMLLEEKRWRDDLQDRYGAQMRPRLLDAGRLLERNGIDAGEWAPA